MMKHLRFLFLSMLVMLGMTASAQDAVIDFSGDTDNWGIGTDKVEEARSYTYNGMTITLTPTSGNYFRWYTSGNILLGKQGATLELPAFDFDVERIDIVGTSSASAAVKQNIFVGEEAVSTETTGAKDVTNTYMIAEGHQAAGTVYVLKVTSNHNTQITTIKIYGKGANVKQPAGLSWDKTSATVTIGDDNNVFPQLTNPNDLPVAYSSSVESVATIDRQGIVTIVAAGTTDITASFDGNDTYEAQTVKYQLTVMDPSSIVEGTCADVIAGAEGTVFKVKGTVKSITNTTYGNWIMQDETGEITIYGTLDAEGKTKNFASLGINQGDVVTVQGPKKLYGETVQLVDVTVLAIEHSGEAPTEPTIEGGTTPETAITVAAALTAIEGMKDSQKTTNNYYVKGTVVSVTEISTANGNATFVMADAEGATATLTVFRAKGLEKKNIESEDYLKQGDEVIVYGLLQKYVKDEATTPELVSGYIYSLNGKTEAEEQPVEPYDFVGDGSQQNPYTVADMQHISAEKDLAEGQEQVWVKGIIMGSLNSSGSALLEGENVAPSNIALAETADEADAKKMVPVQLPAGDLRAALNVLDNPANVGKEVLVYGYILQYMSRTGLKNVSDFILDGQKFTDGIETVAAENAGAAPVYNLAGQRVSKAQKGLFIQNGRKFVK